MLYFTEEGTLANFADDNSPNSVGKDFETVICSLTNDTNVLMQWFTDNNFVMNADNSVVSQLLFLKTALVVWEI